MQKRVWAGRVLSGIAVLALSADSLGKLLEVQPVIEGTLALGYPRTSVFTLGVILLSCVVAYAIPRTAFPGALLLTAYLGGAVATHFRVHSPLFTHIMVPVYVAAFVWGGLVLRDTRVQGLLLPRASARGWRS